MHSTALAGQGVLKPVNELSRKVGNVEARVTMRRTVSKSAGSDSIWYGPHLTNSGMTVLSA